MVCPEAGDHSSRVLEDETGHRRMSGDRLKEAITPLQDLLPRGMTLMLSKSATKTSVRMGPIMTPKSEGLSLFRLGERTYDHVIFFPTKAKGASAVHASPTEPLAA